MVREKEISKVEFHGTVRPIGTNRRVKPIVGLDTETERGKAFLLTIAGPEEAASVRIRSWEDVLGALCHRYLEHTFNFFWNLEYDTFALLKHLPIDVLKILARTDRAEYDGTAIRYVPRKALTFRRGQRHRADGSTTWSHNFTFFDACQFYGTIGLDHAAHERLKERKIVVPYDKAQLSAARYDADPVYRGDLDRYAQRDAILCQRLAALLYKFTREIMNPRAFYSPASFAQQFALENLARAMSLPSPAVLDYALKAYQGGRFETFQVGSFDSTIYSYDINSAYPKIESELIACDAGKWRKVKRFDPEAWYAFYKITAEAPRMRISPLRYQEKTGLMIYPTGSFSGLYVNQAELALLRDEGIRTTVIDGWSFRPKDHVLAFPWIPDLYAKRMEWKKINPDMAQVAKIILNGLYGKTIQMNPGAPDVRDHVDPGQLDQVIDFIEENHELRFLMRGRVKAGALFNPIWACEITARPRCQLYEAVRDDPESAVMFATDGILTTKKLNLPLSDELGEWKEEYRAASATIIGSGVYQIRGKAAKARGFTKAAPLIDLLVMRTLFGQAIPEASIQVGTTRTKKLKQSARSADADAWDEFNVIKRAKRDLALNSDKKREWERRFTDAHDVLTNVIKSWPRSGTWAQIQTSQPAFSQLDLMLRQGLLVQEKKGFRIRQPTRS